MSNDAVIALVSFFLIFILEYLFPFFKNPGLRIKHSLTNLGVATINRIIIFLSITYYAFGLAWFNKKYSGILGFVENDLFRILFGLVIFDLWMYWWHRMNHEIYFLWRFHRMHHTDPNMDCTTAVRFHPIEIMFSYFLNLIVLGVLGLNFSFLAVYNVVMVPIILFHHSNIAFSDRLDHILNYLIVMPRMHRVHHSQIREETDSNYGSIFSFWDRLFNSYRRRDNIKSITYGIGTFRKAKWQNIWGMLVLPFKN